MNIKILERKFESTYIKYEFDPNIKVLTYSIVDIFTGLLMCRLEYKLNNGSVELEECYGASADNFGELYIKDENDEEVLMTIDSYLPKFGDSEQYLKELLISLVSLIQRDDK